MLPLFVSIEPSARCSLHCPQCPVGRGDYASETPFMTEELYTRILNQLPWSVRLVQLYFQGEPLLNPALPHFIRRATEKGLHTTLSTNAQVLTYPMAEALIKAGLGRIIVSMDGLSQTSYEQYRVGGSVDKVKAGLAALRDAKERLHGKTHIELQCLYLRSNENEWELLRRQYRVLGADSLTFKTAQFYDYEHGNVLMPDEAHARYRLAGNGLYVPKHKPPRFCRRALTGCVITTNGDVLPCCYDKSHQYILGNLKQESFRAIWHGEKRKAFLNNLRQGRPFPMCINCAG